MGIFDDIKNTAESHPDQVGAGIDRAGDMVDERTGGQHAAQVDQAQEFLKDRVGQPATDPTGAPASEPAPGAPVADEPVPGDVPEV